LAVVALGAGAYALFFDYHLRAAEEATAGYDFDAAQEHLATCIRLWPRSADLHLRAARTARRAGRLIDAAEHLDECQRLQGRTPENLLEYAMLRAQQGDFQDSGPYLLGLLEKDPPEATMILEALAQGANHIYRLGESMHFAEAVLEREPDNVPILLLFAHLWDGSQRFDEAGKHFRAAVEAHPGHAQARLELAQFLFRRDNIEEAANHFEQLRKRRVQTPAVTLGLALCRRHQGRIDEERELLDELLTRAPDDADALTERGKLELDANDLDAAERDLRKAVALAPYDNHANLFLARCLHGLGKDEEAEKYDAERARIEVDMKNLEELVGELAKKPDDVEKHRQAGIICQRNGRNLEAERWFLGAWQIDPRHQGTNQSLVEFYVHIGRPDLAAPYRNTGR
jgi:predicted Zn-dependent protease